jgi:hypothetical protein
VNYGCERRARRRQRALLALGGEITFFWNPDTKVVSSSAEGPVVTLPGSFQSEVGCPGDWQPECLASLMQDGDKDGVYTWSTSSIPSGSYEVKVAHNRNWDENYGVGGAPGGANHTSPRPMASSSSSAIRSRRTSSRSSSPTRRSQARASRARTG